MAKQTINIGASPNDGTGTPLRTAFDYCNLNFTELYTAVGPSGNNIVCPGSATITGDLTVDTNVLKVNTTLNKVSVNTTTFATDSVFAVKTPSGKFDVRSYGGTSVKLSSDATMGYNVATGGEHIFQINDSNELTLNALGLGLGASPSLSGGSRRALTVNASTGQLSILELAVNGSIAGYLFSNATQTTLSSQGSTFFSVETNSTERLRIDSSGNVGIGVTPSAWGAGNKFIDINSSAAFGAFGASDAMMIGNAYWDGSSWIRKTANNAWRFVIESVSSTPTMTWQLAANGSAGSSISSWTQAMTLDASGNLLVGQTTQSVSTVGASLNSNGAIVGCVNGGTILYVNRKVSDGTLVSFLQDNTEEGTISVSGNTVSYNNFAGSHASQLQDGSKTEILRGTVMESINELCVWPNEENERLPKAKISDTAGSKKVYGVFMAWDNEWTITNDFLVTAVGAFICRVNGSVTVQEGDLLESNGDGTARVQADDIIRSSTIGKVTSTVKTHQYDDGSYCVPTVLYCG